MSAPQIPVWTWRDAVRQASVAPLTKLVCYSIGNYLADVGQGCFPSVKTLMADTGLSNKSIATHLQHAVEAGLLVIERRTGRDGRRQLTHYLPRFPNNATLARSNAAMQPAHDDAENDEAESLVNPLHAACPGEDASPGQREPDHVNLVPRELSTREPSIPPKSPKGGPSGKIGDEQGTTTARTVDAAADADSAGHQIALLRAAGRHADAVEHLLAPLAASGKRLSLGKGRALREALAELAARAHGIPTPALAAAVSRIVAHPSKATAAVIIREIDNARQHGEMLTIRAGSPEWAAWQRHLAASDPRQASAMSRSGVWMVRRRWPDGVGGVTVTGGAA